MATETNVGLWDGWYCGLDEPQPYGPTETYELGAHFLAGCSLVEDWGCGKGWLRHYLPPDRYRGIDGSHSPFSDEVADLVTYRSDVPGIFMRHVLEHNPEWRRVLDNALASFTERMVLILFTPLSDETHDLEWEDPPGVPNYSFALEDLTGRIDCDCDVESVSTAVKYGGPETILYLTR